MSERKIWIVVSKQFNPNNLYVKVDGSEFYTAFWVLFATTKESALSKVHEPIAELTLGQAEIIKINWYGSDYLISDPSVAEKIKATVALLNDDGDVQLAAWITSNGCLW